MRTLRDPPIQTARVAVGMPVRRNARTLARAIASVQAQTFGDWRLIVSDDMSDDETFAIAAAAAGKDHRIEVVRNETHLGRGNFAVALSRTEAPYFAWLAGDDYWHPEFLERTVQALDAAPAAVSALTGATFIGPDERPIPNLGFLKGRAAQRIRAFLAHPGGTRMYGLMRTQAVRACFPAKPAEAYDWYLMVALLRRGPQLAVPGQLLFREETGWIDYAHKAESRFPVLRTSLALLRDREIPFTAVPALARLNARKWEEVLAVTCAGTFLRRAALLRRIGLPLTRQPVKLRELAAWHGRAGNEEAARGFEDLAERARQSPQAPLVIRQASPPVTAILGCRNAEAMMGAWLDHAEGQGWKVVVIDHGSTDGTRETAATRRPGPVTEVLDMPYRGFFDLTEQLDLKRKVMATLQEGWVIHADADEFLAPPDGESLAGLLRRAEAADRTAVAGDELLYLPRYEDEAHDPEGFRRTMTWRVRMNERDEKQRLFHSTAALGLWRQTGGHTVTRDAAKLARERVTIHHYIGLSLDDLRGQYLGRVAARRDRFKLWHGNRLGAAGFEIREPDTLPSGAETEACICRTIPVFRERLVVPAVVPPGAVDLVLLAAPGKDCAAARRLLEDESPGLRCLFADEVPAMPTGACVLNLISHPAGLAADDAPRSVQRARAESWMRQVAGARQAALDRGTPYAELRLEDLGADSALLVGALRGLFLAPLLTGTAGFMPPDAPAIERPDFHNPVRAITRALAADLGYR